jgi:hypothetical protein
MRKIEEELLPGLSSAKIKKPYPAPEELYRYGNASIIGLFHKALITDPEIDNHMIIQLIEGIAEWLTYPVITDYFTDEDRSDFEKTIQGEKYIPLRFVLNRNKLRLSPLRNMNSYFEMYDSLIQKDDLKSRWGQLYRITTRSNAREKSIYEKEYSTEHRMHYIKQVEELVKEICLTYINAITPEDLANAH